MSRRVFGNDISEAFQEFLTGCAKVVLWLGLLATLGSVGLLVFTCFKAGDNATPSLIADAVRNVEIFQKVLIVGALALGIGTSYLFWGEELLGAIQLIVGIALYTAPLWLPSVVGSTSNDATKSAFGAIQIGGTVLSIIGIAILVIDLAIRMNDRMRQGSKADHIKLGKGIKEENDKQNVILGKCWQLPFCRKFVREKCPIYHARRTCWKELVGCMCEESVIRGAMENKPIPKDALLAANFIPRNNKLTIEQKKERCYSCVIYNQHQKHKYQVAMPTTVIGFLLIYFVLHGPLVNAVEMLVGKVNKAVNIGTLGATTYTPPPLFVEAMLAVFVLIAFAYTMKFVEFMIFKIKV